MNKNMGTRIDAYRDKLLATVSAAALMTCISGMEAVAHDSDKPILWIELGGQLERVGGGSELLDPAFVPKIAAAGFTSPLGLESKIAYAYGGSGKILFQPEGSDWFLAASFRFGRAHGGKHLHEQTSGLTPIYISHNYPAYTPNVEKFSDTKPTNTETHDILDFQVGKDVGLGMLGNSRASFGLRFADLHSQSDVFISARPDITVHTLTFGHFHYPLKYHHTYSAQLKSDRTFDGIGPAISWEASAPLAGNPNDGEVTFDWGVNAGALFGRQKTKVHHQTTAQYYDRKYGFSYHGYRTLYQHRPADQTRTKSVIVPNLGGFAGLSVRYENVKLSAGYRADVFFGAIDGGIDAHKNYNRGFYGPFASISIGISPSDF